MHFDVPKLVRSPGYDHGHDEELLNGPEIKIDIWDNSVWSPEGFRNSPEGVPDVSRNVWVREHVIWAKGESPQGFWKAQKEVLRSPGARRQGPWRLGPDAGNPGVWPWSPRRTLAFRVKPTLWRLLLQVSTPRLNI